MKAAEKTVLYRELAKMVEAGFHLDRSLALLLSQNRSAAIRRLLQDLQQGLADGLSLAESFQRHHALTMTPLDTAIIEAGERSGQLGAAFNHLAHFYGSSDQATKQMRSAVVYPLILLHLAILLPELPTAISTGDSQAFFLRVGGALALLWISIALLKWIWNQLNRQAQQSVSVDAFLNSLPWIGAARRHWALARFCQVFHTGLLAAMRVSTVCRMAGEASQSGTLKAGGAHAAAAIESGDPLALSLASSQCFDPLFINAIATAEEVGQLDEEMARWAKLEEENAAFTLQQASLWLPKLGYAVIVGFVLYRIFTMVQGYYSNVHQLMENL